MIIKKHYIKKVITGSGYYTEATAWEIEAYYLLWIIPIYVKKTQRNSV